MMQFTSRHNLLYQSSFAPVAHFSSRITGFHPMTFSIDEGIIFTQRFKTKRFTISYHIIDLDKPAVLHPTTPTSILTIHYMLKGSIDAKLKDVGAAPLRENEYNMFLVVNAEHEAIMEPGVYNCFHIDIDETISQSLELELPFFGELLHMMRVKGGIINNQPYSIGERERLIIRDILHCPYTGREARSFLHNCCTELIVMFCENYLKLLPDNLTQYALSNNEIAALCNLKQYITENIDKQFDWEQIASEFKIGIDAIRFGFPMLFLKNASSFLLKERLTAALELLGNTTLSIQVITILVGYDDPNVFVRSFHNYFGKLPNQVRNNLD